MLPPGVHSCCPLEDAPGLEWQLFEFTQMKLPPTMRHTVFFSVPCLSSRYIIIHIYMWCVSVVTSWCHPGRRFTSYSSNLSTIVTKIPRSPQKVLPPRGARHVLLLPLTEMKIINVWTHDTRDSAFHVNYRVNFSAPSSAHSVTLLSVPRNEMP